MTDTEILDWLDSNMVEVVVKRDVGRGFSFNLTFNTRVGCTWDLTGKTLREVVMKCRKYNGE